MTSIRRSTIASERSILVRPLRPLIDHGSPIGEVVVLCLREIDESGPLPFCAMSKTARDRLIAWPVLPIGQGTSNIDHVTLELESRRMHCTYFAPSGNRSAVSQSWKLINCAEENVDLWFQFVIRKSVIAEQERPVYRSFESPTPGDIDRRKHVISSYAQTIRTVDIDVPPGEHDGDYVVGSFLLQSDRERVPTITSQLFLSGGVAATIEGWPDGKFDIAITGVDIGSLRVWVAVANPPGNAKDDVVIGFPRRRIPNP